jgi:hypothetical protein
VHCHRNPCSMETIDMRIGLIMCLLVALVSCTSGPRISSDRVGESIVVRYSMTDVPNEGRIYISYTNDTKAAICLGAENWPSNGLLLNNGEEVSLAVGGRAFFLESVQDYCPRCNIRVEPGAKSVAYLKYESFKLPADLIGAKKTLSFQPVGYRCRSRGS